MPPIIVGQNSAHAIMSPLASASAQVKSRPSLKIVEYDVFISRMPISRQIDTMVELRMFIITISGGDAAFSAPRASRSACSAARSAGGSSPRAAAQPAPTARTSPSRRWPFCRASSRSFPCP